MGAGGTGGPLEAMLGLLLKNGGLGLNPPALEPPRS
jgi:hypothetical protein